MIWLIFLYAVPSLYEAWTDRHGEKKSNKVVDSLLLIAVVLIVSIAVQILLKVSVIESVVLLLSWRLLIFDYLVAYLLIRNGVIVGHWFTYNGKIAWFDRLVSGVNPWVMFLVRVIIFAISLWWFTKSAA